MATTAELADQQAKRGEVEVQKIALLRVEGLLCPERHLHPSRRGPLSEGTVEGAEVTCPGHGARFDVRTGAVLGPPAGQAVKSYPVEVTAPTLRSRCEAADGESRFAREDQQCENSWSPYG